MIVPGLFTENEETLFIFFTCWLFWSDSSQWKNIQSKYKNIIQNYLYIYDCQKFEIISLAI